MIDLALKDYDIDLANSFYVGDSYNDYELARKFNLDFYGIKGKNSDEIFKFNNLLEVINKRQN